MDLRKDSPRLLALLCLAVLALCTAIQGYLTLLPFAPAVVAACYRWSRGMVGWYALGWGLLFDLLGGARFGLHAVAAAASGWLLYPVKRVLFSDSWATLPLFSALYALLYALFFQLLLLLFESGPHLSLWQLLADLLSLLLFTGGWGTFCSLLLIAGTSLRRTYRRWVARERRLS